MEYDPSLQAFQSPSHWFSLGYPRMWEMEVVEDIPTFYDPLFGQGAMQVFSAQVGSLHLAHEEIIQDFPFLQMDGISEKMEAFLQQQKAPYNEEDIRYSHLHNTDTVAVEYRLEDRFYMACMFQKKNIFVLALYNCQGNPPQEEAENIGKILRSLRLHD